ncbi:hypothetical protein [Streptobacillus moniliformis]|uniref:hypothetical protein n=1 Tax=Streptobacillus moniliformis TaxID=34105 RepID=UPI0007E3D6C1|nr:hypothetical protein [Streptobacillus moniliformis]
MRGIFKGNDKTLIKESVEQKNDDKFDIRNHVINKIFDEFNKRNKIFEKETLEDYNKIFALKDEINIKFLITDKKEEKFESMIKRYDLEEDIEVLSTAYLKLDKNEREEIEKRFFILKYSKDGLINELKVKFVKDERYKKEIEILKNYAYLNNLYINYLPLHIFDSMYLIKIVSIYDDIDLYDLHNDKEIELEFDFQGYNEKIKIGYEIFWNIEKINYFANKKIRPTEKNIYFEYVFNLDKNSKYLVADTEKNIYGVINTGDMLKIWTTSSEYKLWNLIKINFMEKEVSFSNNINYGYLKVLNRNCIENIIFSNTFLREGIDDFKFKNKFLGKEEIFLEIIFSNKCFARIDTINYLKQVLKELFPEKNINICQSQY